MTFCFLADLPPPLAKREAGGKILSMSVPVVFKAPSRNELSINFRVSAGFNCSPSIIADISFSFCCWTNVRQSSSTFVPTFTRSIKRYISLFLLRSSILEFMALFIAIRMFLSVQFESWYFAASIRI